MSYTNLLNNYPIFAILQKIADQHHIPTYVVGGFVRDILLKRKVKDIDIVCVGDGIQFAQAFAQKVNAKVSVFKNFGTAMVAWQDLEIEFVGARKESYTPNSRKPEVTQGSLTDDLRRRDFTINALAISLNQEKFGTLIDLFQGLEDLKAKIIRTPLEPHRTFSDDPLRMLRAIRFASQLHFTITPQLKHAITTEANRLSIISKERIHTELNKILLSPKPAEGMQLLDQTKLLPLILPEMEKLKGTDRIGIHTHKDNFKHTLQVLKNVSLTSENLWLRWAALLHDIAKPQTKRFNPNTGFSFHGHEELGSRMVPRIFKRMHLPLNEKMRYVKKLVKLHLRPIALSKEVTDSAVRRLIYEAGDTLDDLMKLCKADITSKNEKKVHTYLHNLQQVEAKIKQVQKHDEIVNLQPVIDGHIIMKTYALKPSKQVGIIRKSLKEALIDGSVANTHSALYAYMLEIGKAQGLLPIEQVNTHLPNK
ncbi:MAG: HD domain-containing protein [Bacteroidota bacterium]